MTTSADDMLKIRNYYAENGSIVMACVDKLPTGPIERNDWNEDDMCQHRWAVVSEATRLDLELQNLKLGHSNAIASQFRFFYRVVALD